MSSDQFYRPPDLTPGLIALGEGLAELAPCGDRLAMGVGGDAANVCVMAARLGARATLVGRIGDDWFGRRLVAFWRSCGVNVDELRVGPGPTGLYLNEPREDGDHAFAYWRRDSAGSRLTPEDVGPELVASHALLVLTGITAAISESAAAAAERARALAEHHGTRTAFVLNHRAALAPDAGRLRALAGGSEIVIGSRHDARAIFGDGDPETVAAALPRCRELVLTDGSAPACVAADGVIHRQPAPPVSVANAAGAGDALAGAYLAGRLAGRTAAASLALGVAASALSVAHEGCARSYPGPAEVEHAVGRLPDSSAAPVRAPRPAAPASPSATPTRQTSDERRHMDHLGKRTWVIADGWIPSRSTGEDPALTSHEAACMLNSGDRPAQVEIRLFFADREPAGPYRVMIAPRRAHHQSIQDLCDPEPVPLDTDYCAVITSDVPIVVQHTRLDSRQAANALFSTIAYAQA